MSRTMEVKLVLSGVSKAAANIRQLQQQAQAASTSIADPNQTRVLQQSRAQIAALPKFLMGPEQRLRMIAAQRAQLPRVADEGRREAIGKDLDRAEFLAKRSIVLHQRRQNDPNALNSPGLLELFRELNGLMKSMVAGNPGAVVHQFARGIQLISAHGGLNISQKLTRAAINPTTVAGSTGSPTQFAGGADQVAGSLAPMLASLGKLGAIALGVVAALAVVVIAVAASIAAIKTFAAMLHSTAQAMAEFQRSVLLSGGNRSSAATLSLLGLDPKNALGFRQSLDDPMAAAAAASVGVRTGGPMPFGRLDSGKMLEQFIKGVSQIEDQTARFRKAVMAGHPELIEQIELYRRHGKTIDADSKVMGEVFDEKSTQQATDFMFQLGRVGKAFENIMFALAKPFLQDATKWLKGFADTLQQVGAFVNQNGALIKSQVMGIFQVFYNLTKWLTIIITGLLNPTAGAALFTMFDKLEKLSKQWLSAPNDPLTDAIRQNTAATQQNTAAMPAGTHGGGQRAQGAIPSHMKGILLEKAIAGGSLRFGAFTP